jgi:predicted DNA-binding ArsR family transcriptional regulator
MKQKLTKEEILNLYHQGYSANIISQQYGINPGRISKILRASGLRPRDYKTMPEFVTNIIKELVLAGFKYLEISRKTNVSYNYIREYVSRSEEMRVKAKELFRCKSNNAVPPVIPPASVCPASLKAAFCRSYVEGTSGFCSLITSLNASTEQAVYLFSVIDEKMIEKHNENINAFILAESKAGVPAIGISKKLGVSPTYVSKVLKELENS